MNYHILGGLFQLMKRENIKFKEEYYKKRYPKIHKSVRIGYGVLILCRDISIGKNSYIQRNCSLTGDIKIGDNCSIASGVNIRSEIHISPSKYKQIIKKIKIGNNVLIGCGSFIKEGVTIGDNVIIGAGSVLTKDVPNGKTFCGIAAKEYI